MLISNTPPSQPGSVSYRLRKETTAAGLVISIDGDVRSDPPPTLRGSAAKAELGAVSLLFVEVTKLTPPRTGAAVHPAGMAGAVTPSKFSEKVVTGTPTINDRVTLIGPRLLLMFRVRVIALPHGVPAGIV
jgi:hypothetical protein